MGKSQDCKRGLDVGDRPRAGEANSLRQGRVQTFRSNVLAQNLPKRNLLCEIYPVVLMSLSINGTSSRYFFSGKISPYEVKMVALEAPNFKKKLLVVYNKIKESNHLVFSIFIS